jgi:zinc protease
MRNRRLAIGLVLGCALGGASGCAANAPTMYVKFPESHAKLKNGVQVVVLPDPTTHLVEADVRYDVGSREDPPGKAGLAHLVEHLIFQQRQAGPNAPPIAAAFRRLTVGYNAYTNWDSTHYQALVAPARLGAVVGLQAAQLQTGCDTIDPDTFAREREVVRNEVRTRYGDPDAEADPILLQAVYPPGHPYRRMIGGDDEQLASITLDDVCRFMRAYYVPERATAIIAGDVDVGATKAIVAATLGALEPRAAAPRTPVPVVTLSPTTEQRELDVEETSVFAAWALPPETSEEYAAADVYLGNVAGRAAAFGAVYEFATGVSIRFLGGAMAPVYVVQVSVTDAGKVEEAKAAIRRAASHLVRIDLDWRRLHDARSRMEAQIVADLEGLGTRAQIFGDYAQLRGYKYSLVDEIARIDRFDPARVSRVGRALLDPDRARFVVIRPKPGVAPRLRRATLTYSVAGGGDTRREDFPVDRGEAAHAVELPEHATPLPRTRLVKLDNGMRLFLLPSATQVPSITVQLSFGGGAGAEPPGRDGLAQAAAYILYGPEGEYLTEHRGARVHVRVGEDSTTFALRGLAVYAKDLIHGLERYVKAGDYSQQGIELWAEQQRQRMALPTEKADRMFADAYLAAIFGAGHPYAHTRGFTPASLGRIGHDELMAWKDRNYTAANATLVVVGDFDVAEVERLVRDAFGHWGRGGGPVPAPRAPAAATGSQMLGVVAPPAATMPLAIGFLAPHVDAEQIGVREVIAEMIQDRVSVVRERLGASYGVHARFLAANAANAYVIRGSLDPPRAGEALRVLRSAIDELRRGDGFLEDFVRARRRVIERRLAGDTSTWALGSRITWLAHAGLSPGFDEDVLRQVAGLTPREALRRLNEDLSPDREVVVLMGTRPAVESAFVAAGIAGAKIVAAE